MRAEDVENRLVLAFINGIMAAGKRADIHTDAIRAGIAAVAPLIAKAERERVAAFVEDAIYTSGGEQPFIRSRAASRSQQRIRDLHHDTLATAIRALD